MNSKKLRQRLKEYKKVGNSQFIPNFKSIIGYATWIKISSDKKFMKEVASLPEEMVPLYYTETHQKVRIARPRSEWYIPIVQEIIDAVKVDQEPSFLKWATHPDMIQDAYLEGFLNRRQNS